QRGGRESRSFDEAATIHAFHSVGELTELAGNLFGFFRDCFYIIGVALGDLALFLVAFMHVETIAEGDALASRNNKVAGGFVRQFLEIVPAKRIGGEQAVVAHVHPRRMSEVLGVSEDSHGISL